MKKVLLATAAVILMTGCSQNEEFENPAQNGEIGFNTAVSHATRAILTENVNFDNFIAYGYAHDGDFDGTTTATVMSEAEYIKSDGAWAADGHYYWPTSGKVTFFGYAGKGIAKGDVAFAKEATKYPTLTYTVLDDISTQKDLVVAQTPNQTKTGDGSSNLTFKHALTQVYFKLKGTDADLIYSVSKIAIKSARKTGTFTYADGDAIGNWVPDATTADYTITLSPEKEVTGGAADPVVLNNAETQVMILMPQTLDSQVAIEVTYSAEKDGVEVHSATTPTVINLTGSWGVGAKIAYVLTLNGDNIKLTGTSDDNSWTPKDENKEVN